MRRNLFVGLLMCVVVVLVLSACTTGTPASACKVRIGYVTDVGRIDDQSFNQASWLGIQNAAKELGLSEDCYSYIETKDTADYMTNIELFAKEKYDIIVTSGYLITETTRKAGETYPDIRFIGTDQSQDIDYDGKDDDIANVVGIVFHEDQSGFLAGALAGLMTKSNVIAGVYGTNTVPPVVRFRVGYEAGAKYVNPDVKILGTYHPGTADVAFTDPTWGGETAQVMLDEGADVVFGAGGDTGNGALIAFCNAGFPVIGVDLDQYNTLAEAKSCLMSSAMKDLTTSVHDQILIAAGQGTWDPGSFYGPVALAPYHDWEDKIPADVKTQMTDLAKKIAAGEIVTCPPGTEGAGCPE